MNTEMIKRLKGKTLKGFTLLELIIVIAIIAVLMMIAVPNMTDYMRMNRMQAANDKAQELYMATQDYLIKLQTSGVDNKKLRDYFGYDGNKMGYIGVDMSAAKSHSGCVANCDRKVHMGDVRYCATGAVHSGMAEDKSLAVLAANGIVSRLSEDFEGAWMVVIYPDTFTVRFAVYSEQPDKSGGGAHAYNYFAVQSVGNPTATPCGYNTTFNVSNVASYEVLGTTVNGVEFRHSNSQEKDYNNSTYANCAYTGQYPVPAS